MKLFKIKDMSTSGAIIFSALLISLSIFVTTWVFFGGNGNRQKLFMKSPTANVQTPEQIKKMQEQRAAQMQKSAPSPVRATSTTTVKTQ